MNIIECGYFIIFLFYYKEENHERKNIEFVIEN